MSTPGPVLMSNEQIKKLAKLRQKKYRQKERLFFVEGMRLVAEAVAEGVQLEQVLFTRDFEDKNPDLIRQLEPCPSFLCDRQRLNTLSETEHHQGIIAVACMREPLRWPVQNAFLNHNPLLLMLDAIADPGNMGTILRTADWFGVKTVLLGKNCVELHNPKVVRATTGSIFRLDCFEDLDLSSVAVELRNQGCRILVSGTDGRPIQEVPPKTPSALVIGSEAAGVSTVWSDFPEERVAVQRIGAGESLNAAVACGILLEHFTRNTV